MRRYLYPTGSVYVLVNTTAKRSKVGMTGIGVNDVAERLRDINEMWSERKVTCQICSGRLLNMGGQVPSHVKSGARCRGGSAPPLEKSVALAEKEMEETKARLSSLLGSEKGSATRIVNTLAKRIEQYRCYSRPVGEWEFSVAYFTEGVAEVEALAHQKLTASADLQAPFGEVFCCSATEAAEAIECAMSELGLLTSAVKRLRLPEVQKSPQQSSLWDVV